MPMVLKNDGSKRTEPTPQRPSPWLFATIGALGLVLGSELIYLVTRDESASQAPPVTTDPRRVDISSPAGGPESSATVATGEFAPVVPLGDDAIVFFENAESKNSNAPATNSPPHYKSVQEAAERSCSTASVKGLSRQIIAQSRCLDGAALVALPERPNLKIGSGVWPYLQASAQRRLVKVLDAHPQQTMQLNSVLRTLAQQYLVWRWGAKKRCGVQLAANPGTSNHERGLALDVSEPQLWRKALEAQKFTWMGKADRVHFDYSGDGRVSQKVIDVLAFQKLWNLNHPKERLGETGRFDASTQRRLSQSPPDGFAQSAHCRG